MLKDLSKIFIRSADRQSIIIIIHDFLLTFPITYPKSKLLRKRLEITDLLAELIKQTDPEEVENAVYLSLASWRRYIKTLISTWRKMMVKAVAKATGEEEPKVDIEFKRIGDLGEDGNVIVLQEQDPFAGTSTSKNDNQ